MVLRGWLDEHLVTLSLKRGALTVALGEETVLAFDRAGRLWSLYTQRHHFRRGLNGNILAKWTFEGARQHYRLQDSEADLVVRRASFIAETLRDRLVFEPARSGGIDAARKISAEAKRILARAAAFDIAAARTDVDHYHRVYKPIGILPPDQYMAIVLQLTEGCSFNTCTFCTFYKDRPFRIKSLQEMKAHIVAVREYLGDSITMRKGFFLADANALVVPYCQLVEQLDVISRAFGETRDVFAFLDGFSGHKKSVQEYAALADRGLQRVYLGLESGHDPLLSWVRKPGRAADALAAVRHMKDGGLAVGIIVMLGLGGTRYANGHVSDTIKLVNQMELDRDDLLYFSEFIPNGTPYDPEKTQAYAQDRWPLPQSKMKAQREAILAGLRFGGSRPKIATYDIREFVY